MSVSFAVSIIDKVTGPARQMSSAFTDMKSSLMSASTSLVDTDGGVGKLGASLASLATPAGAVTAALGAVVAAMAAAVVGVVALTAALVKGAEVAIEQSEAFNKLRGSMNALTGGAGPQTIAVLDSMRAKLGMTREQLAPLAEQLLGMGVPLSDLKNQLTALATVQAVGLNGGTEAYLGILKKLEGQTKVSSKSLTDLYKTGVNVNELAKRLGMSTKQLQTALKSGTLDANKFKSALAAAVQEKGASSLEEQASSLGAQLQLLKENFLQLFEDPNMLKPLTEAFKSLVAIFDKNTASGKAMKAGLTGAFSAIVKAAAAAIPYIVSGILQLIIWSLKAYIFVKQNWGTIATVFKYVAVVMGLVAAAFVVAMLPLIAIGAAIVVVIAAVGALVVGFVWLGSKISDFGQSAGKAIADWASSAYDAASNFISGLVSGITSGASQVIAAVKDLGSSMMGALKGILGIHSPSREMMKLGKFTGQGFAQGVTAANDNVSAAAQGMSAKATGGAMSAGGAGGGKGGGGTYNITINVGGGGGDAQATGKAVVEAVTDLFEQLGLTEGLGSAA